MDNLVRWSSINLTLNLRNISFAIHRAPPAIAAGEIEPVSSNGYTRHLVTTESIR